MGAAFVGLVQGHMSPFMKSMVGTSCFRFRPILIPVEQYGIGGSRTGQDWLYSAGERPFAVRDGQWLTASPQAIPSLRLDRTTRIRMTGGFGKSSVARDSMG